MPGLADLEPEGPGGLTLLVETGSGVMARRIPAAMPLRLGPPEGKAAEDATYGAAALWGLPDFVFKPEIRRLGSGTRELGDGVLIVGDAGIVVQVKRRERPTDDPEKERRWIEKQTSRALRQAWGSVRQLRREPATMTNGRGVVITADGNDLKWLAAVVIDHDDPPEDILPAQSDRLKDSVVLLRRDWEFLFVQLKSTHAVCGYLQRVAGEAVELGTEPVRYYQLATADAAAEPAGLDPRFQLEGAVEVSAPLLPMAPAASEDEQSHRLVRSIFEDIARTRLQTSTEEQRLRILGELDRLHVGQRAIIGQYLRDAFDAVARYGGEEIIWHLRRVLGSRGTTQLGFGVCSRFSEEIQAAFSAWVQLRHHEFTERLADNSVSPASVGVLLTPRRDGQRLWDTTTASVVGRLSLTPDELAIFRGVWNDEQSAITQVS